MNELKFSDGGRKIFNEDLIDIQEHLISIQNIFVAENPFVLGGVEFTSTGANLYDVTEGYIWLDGKIRFFPSTSIDVSSPLYINVLDTDISTVYDDLVTRVSSTEYGIVLESTQSGNESINITDPSTILRYFDNILGDKYLQLNATDLVEVNSQLQFRAPISMSGDVTAESVSTKSLQVNGVLTANSDVNVTGNVTTSGEIGVGGKVTSESIWITGLSYPVMGSDGVVGKDLVISQSIANSAVTEDKIADGSISENKIANGVILSSNIVDGSVTGNKIADESIIPNNIATGAVYTAKIADGAVTENKIADDAVTREKMTLNTLEVLGQGTISGVTINSGQTEITVNHNLGLAISPSEYFILITADSQKAISCNTTREAGSNSFLIVASASPTSGTATLKWQILYPTQP